VFDFSIPQGATGATGPTNVRADDTEIILLMEVF
jgi:hypothetical protein